MPRPHLTSYRPAATASPVVQTFTVTGSGFTAGLRTSLGVAQQITATSFQWTALLPVAGYINLVVTNDSGRRSNPLGVTVLAAPVVVEWPPIVIPPPVVVPTSSTYGQQISPVFPVNAVDIWPGHSIQAAIDGYPEWTPFRLKTGLFPLTDWLTPKTGNSFYGEYGAKVDGAGWVTADGTAAAFRAQNQAITDVLIANLVIQHLPQRAVHAFKDFSARWSVIDCQINGAVTGLVLPHDALVQNCKIQNCSSGAFLAYQSNNVKLDHNEIQNCGSEQKLVEGHGHTIARNWFHDTAVGAWCDGDNSDVAIIDNLFEDIALQAMFYEISERGKLLRNTVRRAETAIFLSTSKDCEVANNVFEDCWRGLTLFLNCSAVGGGAIGFDLTRNSLHDNTVTVGTRPGSYAAIFSYEGTCTVAALGPYITNAKQNTFAGNLYRVPAGTGAVWNWADSNKSFAEWQALQQDVTGRVELI